MMDRAKMLEQLKAAKAKREAALKGGKEPTLPSETSSKPGAAAPQAGPADSQATVASRPAAKPAPEPKEPEAKPEPAPEPSAPSASEEPVPEPEPAPAAPKPASKPPASSPSPWAAEPGSEKVDPDVLPSSTSPATAAPATSEPASEEKTGKANKVEVMAAAENEVTKLLDTGHSLKYEGAVGAKKVFTLVNTTNGKDVQVVKLSPGEKSDSIEVTSKSGGQVKITIENTGEKVYAYIEGGKTAAGRAVQGAGAFGRFLANARFYWVELTCAAMNATVAAVAWGTEWLGNTLQAWHKPAVGLYAAVTLALTGIAYLNARKENQEIKVQEAIKENEG